jgi:hypothetical protein
MDSEIGDLPVGDVHVRGDRIVAVAEHLEVQDVDVIDAAGCIVTPEFIDGHSHCLLRGFASDSSFPQYMNDVRCSAAASTRTLPISRTYSAACSRSMHGSLGRVQSRCFRDPSAVQEGDLLSETAKQTWRNQPFSRNKQAFDRTGAARWLKILLCLAG